MRKPADNGHGEENEVKRTLTFDLSSIPENAVVLLYLRQTR